MLCVEPLSAPFTWPNVSPLEGSALWLIRQLGAYGIRKERCWRNVLEWWIRLPNMEVKTCKSNRGIAETKTIFSCSYTNLRLKQEGFRFSSRVKGSPGTSELCTFSLECSSRFGIFFHKQDWNMLSYFSVNKSPFFTNICRKNIGEQ